METQQLLDLARQLMNELTFCVAATQGEDGDTNARVVQPLPVQDDWTVNVITNRRCRKVRDIERSGRLTLLYRITPTELRGSRRTRGNHRGRRAEALDLDARLRSIGILWDQTTRIPCSPGSLPIGSSCGVPLMTWYRNRTVTARPFLNEMASAGVTQKPSRGLAWRAYVASSKSRADCPHLCYTSPIAASRLGNAAPETSCRAPARS